MHVPVLYALILGTMYKFIFVSWNTFLCFVKDLQYCHFYTLTSTRIPVRPAGAFTDKFQCSHNCGNSTQLVIGMQHVRGREEVIYRSLVGKPEGKRPLWIPRRKWEDNIKMDLQEVGWGKEWIELAQDRDRCLALVNAVMNLRVP